MSTAFNQHMAPSFDARIFNHGIMNCTNDNVIGNYLYSGKALGLTNLEDTIQLHPDLKSQWPYIIEHYHRIGLSHTKNVVWNVSYQELEEYTGCKPSVFFFGEDTSAYLKQPSWFDVVQFINSKNNFMTLANVLGIPVPTTYCYSDKFNLHKFERFTYPCYLKIEWELRDYND